MSSYILDTGVLLGYTRGADYAKYIEAKYSVSQPPNLVVISVVTVGEILSLAFQFNWGQKNRDIMQALLSNFTILPINDQRIIERYADIDAFSQGRHTSYSLPQGMTARNMGKNDVWIAATGSVLKATLLTTDADFRHLDNQFLDVIYIDQKLTEQDASP